MVKTEFNQFRSGTRKASKQSQSSPSHPIRRFFSLRAARRCFVCIRPLTRHACGCSHRHTDTCVPPALKDAGGGEGV